MELVGKVVVVTGASMGIGEAISKLFAEQGANVVLLSRDSARAEAARAASAFPTAPPHCPATSATPKKSTVFSP